MKVSLLFWALTSHWTLAHTMLDPTQVLQFPISKVGLTRISLENDSIDEIFAYPADIVDHIQHHQSGHLFVAAEKLEGPIYITILSKRGLVQDLKLIPTSKRTEPIILKVHNDEVEVKKQEEEISALLNRFLQGFMPQGFYPITISEASRNNGPLTSILEEAYQNAYYRVLVFKVTSEHPEHHPLDSQLMWSEGDLAIAFDQPHLRSSQSAKMFVIQKY